MKKIMLCTVATALMALGGCEYSPGMADRTIAYNKAIADSTNEFFLLNAVRASERFPIYYSHTTGDTATTTFSPEISISLPLGPDAIKSYGPNFKLDQTSQNQQTLANLDDQNSMRGVLAPISASTLGFFFQQGWPKEVIFMMALKRIEIDRDLVQVLITDFNDEKRCKNLNAAYCEKALPELQVATDHICAGAAQCTKMTMPSPSKTLQECVKSMGPKDPTDENNYVMVFDNYPTDSSRLKCFQAVLRVLIALGLEPASGLKFDVLAQDVNENNIANLKGLADATTAKLSISKELPGDSPRVRDDSNLYAVCTKSDVGGFTIDPTYIGKAQSVCDAIAQYKKNQKKSNSTTSPASSITTTTDATALASAFSGASANVREETTGENSTQSTTSIFNLDSAPKNCGKQVKRDAQKFKDQQCLEALNCDSKPDQEICKKFKPPKFNFTTRSLDSMIFYLGEIIRAHRSNKDNQVTVWTRDPGDTQLKQEPLFLVTKGGLLEQGVVSAKFRDDTYIIPSSCSDPGTCIGSGTPHRSLQVLSFLNQIWGLQKQATETPTVPSVTVINP